MLQSGPFSWFLQAFKLYTVWQIITNFLTKRLKSCLKETSTQIFLSLKEQLVPKQTKIFCRNRLNHMWQFLNLWLQKVLKRDWRVWTFFAGTFRRKVENLLKYLFRVCLVIMMFVNYGGGQYMFFEHANWHGEYRKFIIKTFYLKEVLSSS